MAKGSDFEREFCKDLSLWWSDGGDQDIFWRSQNSGGRATMRMKTGGTLLGQEGDIAATKPDGLPLLAVCAVELKRGYSESNPWNTIDKGNHLKQQEWEAFVEQAMSAAKNSGAWAWMLVHRRDQRRAFVFIPHYFFKALKACGSFPTMPQAFVNFNVEIRKEKQRTGVWHHLVAMPLEAFFEAVQPTHIRELALELA